MCSHQPHRLPLSLLSLGRKKRAPQSPKRANHLTSLWWGTIIFILISSIHGDACQSVIAVHSVGKGLNTSINLGSICDHPWSDFCTRNQCFCSYACLLWIVPVEQWWQTLAWGRDGWIWSSVMKTKQCAFGAATRVETRSGNFHRMALCRPMAGQNSCWQTRLNQIRSQIHMTLQRVQVSLNASRPRKLLRLGC